MRRLSCLLALVLAAAAAGDEFVLYRAEATMTANWPRTPIAPHVPRNWFAPVDYADGTMHYRLRVLDYPTERKAILLFGMLQGSAERMMTGVPPFRGTGGGLILHSCPVARMFVKGVDLAKPLTTTRVQLLVYLNDDDRDWHDLGLGPTKGGGHHADYLPFHYHLTVVVTAKGSAFPGWEHYPMPGHLYAGIEVQECTALPALARAIAAGDGTAALRAAEAAGERGAPYAARLQAYLQARRTLLEARLATDPVGSVEGLALLGREFAGTAAGKELTARAQALAKEDGYRRAARAQQIWAGVEPAVAAVLEAQAQGRPAQAVARHLATIRAAAQALEGDLADTPAAERLRRALAEIEAGAEPKAPGR